MLLWDRRSKTLYGYGQLEKQGMGNGMEAGMEMETYGHMPHKYNIMHRL